MSLLLADMTVEGPDGQYYVVLDVTQLEVEGGAVTASDPQQVRQVVLQNEPGLDTPGVSFIASSLQFFRYISSDIEMAVLFDLYCLLYLLIFKAR